MSREQSLEFLAEDLEALRKKRASVVYLYSELNQERDLVILDWFLNYLQDEIDKVKNHMKLLECDYYLTTPEASDFLNVSESYVRALISKGGLDTSESRHKFLIRLDKLVEFRREMKEKKKTDSAF